MHIDVQKMEQLLLSGKEGISLGSFDLNERPAVIVLFALPKYHDRLEFLVNEILEENKIKLEDFVPGFEYEMKSGFADGRVKTVEEFNAQPWEKRIYKEGDFPYIERIFKGRNAKNGLLGLRHVQKKK